MFALNVFDFLYDRSRLNFLMVFHIFNQTTQAAFLEMLEINGCTRMQHAHRGERSSKQVMAYFGILMSAAVRWFESRI